MTYEKIFPESVDILGTPWKIVVKKYDDEPYFKKNNANGYCSGPEHLICICDESTWPTSQDECETFLINCMKSTLRHEIVHAFFKESGLNDSSFSYGGSWAKNEEMVDWIALQGPKIYEAWKKCYCLEYMSVKEWLDDPKKSAETIVKSKGAKEAKRDETLSETN